jgi:hypothetical protein
MWFHLFCFALGVYVGMTLMAILVCGKREDRYYVKP